MSGYTNQARKTNKLIGMASTLSVCALFLLLSQNGAKADAKVDSGNNEVNVASASNVTSITASKTVTLSSAASSVTSSSSEVSAVANQSAQSAEQSSESATNSSSASAASSADVQVTNLGDVDSNTISEAQASAAAQYAATGQQQMVTAVAASSYSYTDAFLASIKQAAIDGWTKYGVLPSITAAQAICESAWGQSELATEGHNLFGIKGSYNGQSITFPTQEWYNGSYVTVQAAFRKYANYAQSIEDHGAFLKDNSRYSNLLGDTSYVSVANKLHADGYATSPTYASTLISIIQTYHLYDWDHAYNTVNETLYADYYGTIHENGRQDGLFVNGGYNTNSSNVSSVAWATQYNGTRVHVTQEESVSNGATYVQISLNGRVYWIDKAALSIEYHTVSDYQTVDYAAVISQNGRADGIYSGGPYMTSFYATASNNHGKNFNGTKVHVIAEEKSAGALYYEFEYNGQKYWMDSAGFKVQQYNKQLNTRSVSYDVKLTQSTRHDGIYYGGIYFTNGQTYYANDHGKYYDGVIVHVIAEASSSDGSKFVEFQYNGQNYWIDQAGTQKIVYATYKTTSVSYNVVLNQSGRHDGIYYGSPYATSRATSVSNTNGQYFNGLTAHVIAEAKTTYGSTFVEFEYQGQDYWIDKAGTISIGSSFTITKENYNAKIDERGARQDGIYFAGPYAATSFSKKANGNGKYFNGSSVNVVAQATYDGATYVQFKLNGSYYWMDRIAIHV